ncbi:MAG: hypothetical protein LBH73_02795 [Spirochaetaceae bacterium]|jgi:predicted transposase YdaD|nr:hypothetical protein [Spirochaetaceae bacterium]
MLLTEWNWDDAREVWQEESREEGWEKGRKEGQEKGREEGREIGREEGENTVLELMEQGYTAEQIRLKLAAVKSDRTETAGK